jgi:hypothetical protein
MPDNHRRIMARQSQGQLLNRQKEVEPKEKEKPGRDLRLEACRIKARK